MMPIGTNALFLWAEYLCPWAAPKPMGSSHSQPMGITCPLAGTIAHSQLVYRNALPIGKMPMLIQCP
ncbi:DNA-directed RNA polymerase III subunit [Frankliniella fusca]|uniref:DNA-directed RNA polymerase III subunit n=1 Tax=Frankliniella fusca TaxID=407009 RepID=A0AAE1L587_9NEOP|nr:DNA-directed RNA polymerase III subunit [Frankliniella fusca]